MSDFEGMDFSCPAIPPEVLPVGKLDVKFTIDCLSAWNDVILELTDQSYLDRSHHNSGTYNAGCKGPLCRKALRDKKRRSSGYAPRSERNMDPILEYFHTVGKNRINKFKVNR